MGRLSLLAVFFLISLPIEGGVVKIGARHCSEVRATRFGTALVFKHREKKYAVSSYFLLTSGKNLDCFEVYSSGEPTPAKLLFNDWGRDLVLFELSPTSLGEFPELSSLAVATPKLGLSVFWSLDEKGDKIQDHEHYLSSIVSSRHSLPNYSFVFESSGKGMSEHSTGGVLFNKAGALIGIASRQYVKLVAGSVSQVMEWGHEAEALATKVLLLPWANIAPAILAVLEGDKKPIVLAEPEPTVPNAEIVKSGRLRFQLKCPEGTDPESPIGPIGGPDGVGIGGESKATPFCKSLITLNPSPTITWPFTQWTKWKTRLVEKLEIENEVLLRYFVIRDATENRLVRVPFWQLSGAFKSLAKPFSVPVTWNIKDPVEAAPNAQWAKARVLSIEGLELARMVYSKCAESFEMEHYLREIYLLLQVTASEEASYTLPWSIDGEGSTLVRVSDYARLLDFEPGSTFGWANHLLLQSISKVEAVRLFEILKLIRLNLPDSVK